MPNNQGSGVPSLRKPYNMNSRGPAGANAFNTQQNPSEAQMQHQQMNAPPSSQNQGIDFYKSNNPKQEALHNLQKENPILNLMLKGQDNPNNMEAS